MTRVVICGGGHLAHALAAVTAVDHSTAILTRNPFVRTPLVARTKSAAVISDVRIVTDDPRTALAGAEAVLLAVPAFARSGVLQKIAPFLTETCWVGAMPGIGAFHQVAPKVLHRQSRIFVTRESPFNCRVHERGQVVDVLGIVPELGVVAVLRHESAEAASLIEDLLNIPTRIIDDPVIAMLRPVNIALHPVVLLKLFGEQKRLGGFMFPPDLYSSWDEECSALYLAASNDLEEIACALELHDPTEIQPVARHYKTDNPVHLAKIIRTLPGLSGLKVPCVVENGRFFIDRQSRIIAEDVLIGVQGAVELAAKAGCSASSLKSIAFRFDILLGDGRA